VTDQDFTTLLIVFACVAAAPLLAHVAGRAVRVPIVVVEIVLGILVGPGCPGLGP
jgi:Kef-type K+ transport system membrane component KefB